MSSTAALTMVRVSTPPRAVWTIGHSNHELDEFAALVETHALEFVIDVRSYPYSRFAPHFNREDVKASLEARGVRYVFMGSELGGRPLHDAQYDPEGHALYGLMAEEPAFRRSIERLIDGSVRHRLCIMCSCGEPEDCHRRLLIGKVLTERGVELRHILPNGTVVSERKVRPGGDAVQSSLFEENEPLWRSTRSVSHRRRLSTSSSG